MATALVISGGNGSNRLKVFHSAGVGILSNCDPRKRKCSRPRKDAGRPAGGTTKASLGAASRPFLPLLSLLPQSAASRYEELLRPALFNQAPVNQPASYLGMAKETLSRLPSRAKERARHLMKKSVPLSRSGQALLLAAGSLSPTGAYIYPCIFNLMNKPKEITGFLALRRGNHTFYENQVATLLLQWPPAAGWVHPWLVTVPTGLEGASALLGYPDDPETWFDAAFTEAQTDAGYQKTYVGKMIINATIMDATTCRVVEPLTVQITQVAPPQEASSQSRQAWKRWKGLLDEPLGWPSFYAPTPFASRISYKAPYLGTF